MKSFIATLVAAIGLPLAASSQSNPMQPYEKPDFAYPQQVIVTEQSRLKAAIKADDARAMLRALLNLSLSQTAVSADNMPTVISRIDQLRADERDPDTAALLDLLLAQIYSDIYTSKRRLYDERPEMLGPLPDSYLEWSGNQMRNRIAALLRSATTRLTNLNRVPVTDFADVVTVDSKQLAVYNTSMADFTANEACNILTAIGINDLAARAQHDAIVDEMVALSRDNAAQSVFWGLRSICDDSTGSTPNNDRAARLQELFDLWVRKTPASVEILERLGGYASTDDEALRRQVYADAKDYIARYPDYPRVNIAKNLIGTLETRHVSLNAPNMVYPGTDMPVDINISNTPVVAVTLWEVPATVAVNDNYVSDKTDLAALRQVDVVTRSFDGAEVPFSRTVQVPVRIPKPGRYVVSVSLDDKPERPKRSTAIIICSKLASLATAADATRAYALDAKSGAPLKGVTINKITQTRREKPVVTRLGISDADGALAYSPFTGWLQAAHADDRSPLLRLWQEQINGDLDTRVFNISGYSSLALYHPGDTLQWCAVAYEAHGYNRSLLSNISIKAEVLDANREVVAVSTLKTDSMGRVQGQCLLPTDRLTGDWAVRLNAKVANGANKNAADVWGDIAFVVSDYKLPTYEVALANARPGTDGSYIVSGNATTYSGMPVADAEVTLNLLCAQPIWRWLRQQPQSMLTKSAKTDAKGAFTFTITATEMAQSPWPKGLFTADITVVSTAGESHEASTTFSLRPLCLIEAEVPNVIDISEPVTLNVKATDIDGNSIDRTVSYKLMSDDRQVRSGVANDAPVDFTGVKPGVYSLMLSVDGNDAGEPLTIGNITLYKPANAPSPSNEPVWAPTTSANIGTDGAIDIIYGTPAGESHVLASIIDSQTGKMLMCKWLTTNGGMARLSHKLPTEVANASLTLTSMRDFNVSTVDITLTRPNPADKLVIKTQTLRDKTSPLEPQTWSFTFENVDGTPVEAAVVVDMYSKALDQLAEQSWRLPLITGPTAQQRIYRSWLGSTSFYNSSSYTSLPVAALTLPEWQLWGRQFVAPERMRFMMTRAMAKGAEVSEEKTTSMAMSMAADYATEDAMVEMAADNTAGNAASPNDDKGAQTPDINYRPTEIPLALFRPMLTTDAKGHLTMSFTMPNVVTTWQFNLLAYTAKLATSTYSAQIVSSKPVMVQPNLPRFVRSGDKISIATSVYNKTDAEAEVAVTAVASSATDAATMAKVEQTVSVEPQGSTVVTLPIDVNLPAGALMQVRVSGVSGLHTDGEMATIPVLQSAASVIESHPFYIPTDSTSTRLELPKLPADAVSTLQYCDNPLWLCVMALPSLSQPSATTATQAASNLMMSVIARNIVERYPQIAKAINEWSASDKSQATLTSMLDRNNDLKQLLLQATPWMRQARTDTERMQRLALLLDSEYTRSVTATALKRLGELQTDEGGFKWYTQSTEPSVWTTEYVLSLLGALNSMHWLPTDADVNAMVSKALKYYDNESVAAHRRYPKSSTLGYALVRSMFGQRQSDEAAKLTSLAVERALKDWKGYNIPLKARTAMLLNANEHADIARDILRSIGEYAISSPDRGMHWQDVDLLGQTEILNAYVALKAKGAEVDAIRQWIIFEKEAQDFGNSPQTSLVVARLLTSSATWIEPGSAPTITLGDKKVDIAAEADYGSGFFTQRLDTEAASGATLTVERAGNTPSWGAVVTQYTQEATDIKSASIKDLSIEKALLVGTPGADGMRWSVAQGPVSIGTPMQVRLTLKAGRNIDYVTIVDQRAAGLQPTDQLPGNIYSQNICFYRENGDADTRIFIENLPKGTYVLTYDVSANNAGVFTSGVATVQSQITPSLTAHSAGNILTIKQEQ